MLIRLLLVENNPGDALLLRQSLESAYPDTYCMAVTQTLADAKRMLGQEAFDAVLLDLGLPDSQGADTVSRLREAAPDLPLVAMTGLDDEEVALEAIRQGAQDYLLKGQASGRTIARSIRYAIERKQAEDALRHAKEQWEQTFNSVPDLIAILDDQHRIVRVNRAMARRLGCSVDECVGVPCYRAVHGADRPPDSCPHVRTLADGGEHMAEVREEHLGGDFLVTTTPLPDANGRLCGAVHVARDITGRKRTEERLRLLSEVTAQLLTSENPQQLIESLCRKVMEHLECHAFFNFLVDEQTGRLHLNACAGIPEDQARRIEWLELGEAVCGCAARDGCRIVAEHVQTTSDPRTELVRSLGVEAYACHPLLNQGRVIGTLSFGSRTRPAFSADDLSLMKTVTDHVAIAMQRIRLLEVSQRHARQSQAANVAKSRFLANMSHELRTPMTAVLGMTDLALNEELPATVRDYLQTVRESAAGLLELLNEILDFSRIEEGHFELEATSFDLPSAVEQVVKTFGVQASDKGLEVIVDLSDDLPRHFVGDPLRLRQVLMNLVGNAIKFTQKGEVVVSVRRNEEGARQSARVGAQPPEASPPSAAIPLQFSISDTGIGITPDNRERIFAPFTQADASMTRCHGGTGLGLTISHRLVSLMGGNIEVESQPGRGSTFHFTLALPIGVEPAGQGERRLLNREAFRDVSILVVAENAASRRTLQNMLTRWSMQPEVASDVPRALAMLYQAASAGRPYRLVLADAVMSGTDGFTLAGWIKGLPELAGAVVLMLSPADRQNHPDRCAAAVAWVEKPISSAALHDALAGVLGLQQRVARGEPAAGNPVAAPARPLQVLLAEDTLANQKLVVHALGKRGHHIEIAQNGQEAVELLRRRDFDAVLMDLQMPVMDGFQATEAIRRLTIGRKARVPIIAMTAHVLKGDQERCLAAGMDAYLSKPLDFGQLVTTVEAAAEGLDLATGRRRAPDGLEPPPTAECRNPVAPTTPSHSVSVFSLDDALGRCGNYELFQEMVKYFFSDAKPVLEEIRDALHGSDAVRVARAAHRLRGTMLYLGGQSAIAASKELERAATAGDLKTVAGAIDALETQVDLLRQSLEPHRCVA